jgi:hypothetical protein
MLITVETLAQTKIAILDTGYVNTPKDLPLCKSGHYDALTGKIGVPSGKLLHGYAVSKTLHNTLQLYNKKNYCFVLIKVYKSSTETNIVIGILKAIAEKVDYINLSVVGDGFNAVELVTLLHAVNNGIKIFVASGNNGRHLTKTNCKTYPPCYNIKEVNVVGAIKNGIRAKYSNYGPMVNYYESGMTLINGNEMHGTSFSTPRALGKYIGGAYAKNKMLKMQKGSGRVNNNGTVYGIRKTLRRR